MPKTSGDDINTDQAFVDTAYLVLLNTISGLNTTALLQSHWAAAYYNREQDISFK